jgi:mono/diheme cytochrome c family protein
MNNFLFIIVTGFCLTFIISLNGQSQGEKLFSQNCGECHTIGGGELIGPDLANIQNIRTKEWIIKFVKSAQSVINTGDPVAKELDKHYSIVMPDQDLTDKQIESIIIYIKSKSPEIKKQ